MKSKLFILGVVLLFSSSLLHATQYYRIKNHWTGEYLHIENKLGHLQLKTNVPQGWWSAQWEKVPTQRGFFRLRNRWTHEYIHIEQQLGHAQLSQKGPAGGWWSSQWKAKPIDGYVRLKNRWTKEFLHIENRVGHTELKKHAPRSWWSAQWRFEPVAQNNISQCDVQKPQKHHLVCKGSKQMNINYTRNNLEINFKHAPRNVTPNRLLTGECTWSDASIRRDEPYKICHTNLHDVRVKRERGIYTMHSNQARYLSKLNNQSNFSLKVHNNHRGCFIVDRVIY